VRTDFKRQYDPTFARNVSDKIEVDGKMYPAPTATVIGYAGW
jgi:hypothetical protein